MFFKFSSQFPALQTLGNPLAGISSLGCIENCLTQAVQHPSKVLLQPLASACQNAVRWVFSDHTAQWAAVLPAWLAPVPEIPFISEASLASTQDEQEKVAQIFDGKTLSEFYEEAVKLSEAPDSPFLLFVPKTERGNFVFVHRLLPDRVIKTYIPSEEEVPLPRRIKPVCFDQPEEITLENDSLILDIVKKVIRCIQSVWSEYFGGACPKVFIAWEGKASSCGRALMAQRMRLAIKKYNLEYLYVPHKTICPISDRPGAEKVVLAERLSFSSIQESRNVLEKLPLETKRLLLCQLYILFYSTGAIDMKLTHTQGEGWDCKPNMLFINSGEHKFKLAIFDTETFGLDELHAGTHSEKLFYSHYSEEMRKYNPLHRNIYSIGGNRNLDLAIGLHTAITMQKEIINTEIDFPGSLDLLNSCARMVEAEFRSNLTKIKRLRAILPAALLAAMAMPLLKKI